MTASRRVRCCHLAVEALLLLGCTGCAFKIVRTPPLVVRSSGTGAPRVVNFPARILVHDDRSFWDAHQIKNNTVGVFQTEIVHLLDLGLDAVIPGPDVRPLQSGIESIKNGYSKLPDCAPVRIVGGFFSALGIEKTTVLGGVWIPATGEPVTYFAVTRVIYLTDWVQDTLGEVNAGLGHLVPWDGPFFPGFVTAPINDAVDWCQSGLLTGYLYVFHQLSLGVDTLLYGGEWTWGEFVSVFVDNSEPVYQAPSEAAPAEPPEKP